MLQALYAVSTECTVVIELNTCTSYRARIHGHMLIEGASASSMYLLNTNNTLLTVQHADAVLMQGV
jgi:hypothetical protein